LGNVRPAQALLHLLEDRDHRRAAGPRFIVREGTSGFIVSGEGEFCRLAARPAGDRGLRYEMALHARHQAEDQSWDKVLEEVYDSYSGLLQAA